MKVVKHGIAMDFAFHAETELFCNFFPGNKKLLQKERIFQSTPNLQETKMKSEI